MSKGVEGLGHETRRSLLRMSGALLSAGAAGALGACTFGQSGGASPVGSPPTPSLAGVSVEYWPGRPTTRDDEGAAVKVLESFGTENTAGIKMVVAEQAGISGAPAYAQKIIAAMAAGTPPDLICTWNYFLSGFFNQGGTVDVDAALKGSRDWGRVRAVTYPSTLVGNTWKGKLFGVPVYNSFSLLYYQADLLKRAGLQPPPKQWTWDQFLDMGRKAARPPDVTVFDDQWDWEKLSFWMLNNGAKLMSADGTKFILTSAEAREAVEWLQGLVRAGLMRAHDGSANGGYAERLPRGEVVFQRAVQARIPDYRRQGVPFGTTYWPIGPKNTAKTSYTHGTPFAFSAFKKDDRTVQASLQAAMWFARPESVTAMAAGGVAPSFKNIVESSEFQNRFKQDAESWPFLEAVSGFLAWPSFPTLGEALPEVRAQLSNIWAGTTTVTDGLREAERIGQQYLDQAMKGN